MPAGQLQWMLVQCALHGEGLHLALFWSMVGADKLHQIGVADRAQRPHIIHHLMPLLLQHDTPTYMSEVASVM